MKETLKTIATFVAAVLILGFTMFFASNIAKPLDNSAYLMVTAYYASPPQERDEMRPALCKAIHNNPDFLTLEREACPH